MSKKSKNKHKKTMTEKALAANQANAQKSTGPNTPEGKAKVSINAATYWLTSPDPVAPWENMDEYEFFSLQLEEEWQPVGATQRYLFDRMVADMWRILRVYRAEVDIMCAAQDQEWLSRERDKLSRYEMRFERSVLRMMDRLLTLKGAMRNLVESYNQSLEIARTAHPGKGQAMPPLPPGKALGIGQPEDWALTDPLVDGTITDPEIIALSERAMAGRAPQMPILRSGRPPARNRTEEKLRDLALSVQGTGKDWYPPPDAQAAGDVHPASSGA